MATDVSGLLARKYDILGQTAAANAADALSRSRLADEQTRLAAGEAASRNAANLGAAAAGRGSGALSLANARQVPGLAGSEIGLHGAQAGLFGAQAQAQNVETGLLTAPVSPITAAYTNAAAQASLRPGVPGYGSSIYGDAFGQSVLPGSTPMRAAAGTSMTNSDGTVKDPLMDYKYSSGTAKVPGKGSPKVDSVDAKLAPGEAVLNAAAADHLGRTTIALLNAIGEQKMGLGMNGDAGTDSQDSRAKPDASVSTTANRPGYAKGTAKVPAKQAAGKPGAKAPGKPAGKPAAGGKGDSGAHISPKLLAALMAGAGGQQPGAGMPPPGGMQPMPMPMPQVAGQPPQ